MKPIKILFKININSVLLRKSFTAISLAIYFIVLLPTIVLSQRNYYDEYLPLKSIGLVPNDFKGQGSANYEKELKGIEMDNTLDKNEKKKLAEKRRTIVYQVENILSSGKVLYGNKVCQYINKVSDKVLNSSPELKKDMRFYLLNSQVSKSFTTNNGITFISTGLMSQIENEAQLAFVISREAAHYKLKHNFEFDLDFGDFDKELEFELLSSNENFIDLLKYEYRAETAADEFGLQMIADAGYNPSEAINLLQILQYSYSPIREIPFPKNYFNDSFYQLPTNYFQDSITPFSTEDGSDSLIFFYDERIAKLESFLKPEIGQKFLLGSAEFEDVIKTCRYELAYLYIISGNYNKSFYHSFILKQLYGNNMYTSDLMVASLLGLHKKKLLNEKRKDDAEDDDVKVLKYEGEISIPYLLFKNMKSNEFNVLVAKEIQEAYASYPSQYAYKVLCEVFTDLFYSHNFVTESFNQYSDFLEINNKNDVSLKIDTLSLNKSPKVQSELVGKVSKIRKVKGVKQDDTEDDYYKNAFVKQFNKNTFIFFLDSISSIANQIKHSEKENSLAYLRNDFQQKNKQVLIEDKKLEIYKGKALGIDSLIFVSTNYSATYYDCDELFVKQNPMKDERRKEKLSNFIHKYSDDINLKTYQIDVNNKANLTTSQLNEYATISFWMIEKFSQANRNYPLFSQRFIDTLVLNTGFKNICLSGVSYKSRQHEVYAGIIVAGVLLFPAAPLLIGEQIDSDKNLLYYAYVFDLLSEDQKFVKHQLINRRPKLKLIKTHLAYTLFQIKSKKRYKKQS